MAQGYKPYAKPDVKEQYVGKVHSVGDNAGQTRPSVSYAAGSGPGYYPYQPQQNGSTNMLGLQGMSQHANMGYQPVDYSQYSNTTMTAYGAASIAMGTHYSSTTGSADASCGTASSMSDAPRSLPSQQYYAYPYSTQPPHLCHRDSYDSTNSDLPHEDLGAEHTHQSMAMVYGATGQTEDSSSSSHSSNSSIIQSLAATSMYNPAYYQSAEAIDPHSRYDLSPKTLGAVLAAEEKPAAEQLEHDNPEGLEAVATWCWDGPAE